MAEVTRSPRRPAFTLQPARPRLGPTSEKELPVGEHAYQLYSLGTPNGVKVSSHHASLSACSCVTNGERALHALSC